MDTLTYADHDDDAHVCCVVAAEDGLRFSPTRPARQLGEQLGLKGCHDRVRPIASRPVSIISQWAVPSRPSVFFSFLYFSKSFFTEIYFRFHNLQVCTPTARQEGRQGASVR